MSPQGDEPAVLKDFYFKALVSCVASHLGAKLKGLVSGGDSVLLFQALASGEKSQDFVEKSLVGLSTIGAVLSSREKLADVPKLLKREVAAKELENAVRGKVDAESEPFYVFIDEPDEVGTEDSAAARLWGLLNACRDFAKKVNNLRCVVSLRTEMWRLLVRSEAGKKNVDHFRPLMISLDSHERDIRNIVEKRVEFVSGLSNLSSVCDVNDAFATFFEGNFVQLPPPAKDEQRSWIDFIVKSSRARPRDAIQLLKMLSDNAIASNREKIGPQDVLDCAAEFSKSRLSYLEAEYEKDFPSSKCVYEFFASYNFSIPTDDMRNILKSLLATNRIFLKGHVLVSSKEEDVFALWNMLYQTEFVSPCVPDSRMVKNYRILSFESNDDIVTPSNYRDMQKYTWEIHPAYRAYLYTLRDEEISRKKILDDVKRYSRNPNYVGNVKKFKKR